MTGVWRSQVGRSLRALASPGAVLALVVLVLNDHWLKQAWPGWVTGKLSDVAGLVVAPLLLAVLLALARVPRPTPVAVAATGAGFVLCKTTAVGAAVTSSVWSLFGTPTLIRADVTDLLALPALYGAWWLDARVRRSPATGWRRTLAATVGAALLPVGVLATSATSCSEAYGYASVAVLEGDFPGSPAGPERRLGLWPSYDGQLTIDRTGAFLEADVELDGPLDRTDRACVGERCWRLAAEDAVDASVDGGDTWFREAELTAADREEITDEVGTDDGCDGEPPAVGATDVAALADHGDGGLQVVVALQRGGIWQRQYDGTWEVLTETEVDDRIDRDRPPPPTVTEVDGRTPERPEEPPAPGVPEKHPEETAGPGCASPTWRTVTPNPMNGPPTTYAVCP